MYKSNVYLSMNERQDTNGETPKMAMSKLYEVIVAVKVVVHAFDDEDAERQASQNLENTGWSVRYVSTIKRIKS